jgi:hypothetical protein
MLPSLGSMVIPPPIPIFKSPLVAIVTSPALSLWHLDSQQEYRLCSLHGFAIVLSFHHLFKWGDYWELNPDIQSHNLALYH